MNLRPFSLNFSLLVGACSFAVSASAQDQTINGNLFVNSALDVNGNTASFGTNGLNPGYTQIYTNNALATVDFSASASTVNWTWYQGNTSPQLKLDSTNKLNLYSTANPTTAQIVLNPVGTSTFAQGLTVTGTLTTGGAFTTSGSLTTSGGTVTGGTNGLTINSGGTNKNITLSPNGTGVTTTAKPLRVTISTTSTSSTTGALTVSGGVGVAGALNVGAAISTSRLTVAGIDATAANSVANFTDSAAKSLLFVRNDGNVGVGTTAPANRLTVTASTAIVDETPLRISGGSVGFSGSNDANKEHGLIIDLTAYSPASNIVQRDAAAITVKKVGTWNETDNGGTGIKSDLIFKTQNGSIATPSLAEKVRITSAGNVGIGTTTPTVKLDVVGDAKVSGTLTVKSVLRIPPSGDLGMGTFISGTNPATN